MTVCHCDSMTVCQFASDYQPTISPACCQCDCACYPHSSQLTADRLRRAAVSCDNCCGYWQLYHGQAFILGRLLYWGGFYHGEAFILGKLLYWGGFYTGEERIQPQ